MKEVEEVVIEDSMKAILSAIGKSERALIQMSQKGANTSLLSKRLKALSISLDVLKSKGKPLSALYSNNDLIETRSILTKLLIPIERIYNECKIVSPQRTLLERRIKAINLVIQMIDENQ